MSRNRQFFCIVTKEYNGAIKFESFSCSVSCILNQITTADTKLYFQIFCTDICLWNWTVFWYSDAFMKTYA